MKQFKRGDLIYKKANNCHVVGSEIMSARDAKDLNFTSVSDVDYNEDNFGYKIFREDEPKDH
jgi:hypothetical protein